eukprot:1319331-Alexandrium_andersonii.AAC.1
MRRSAGLPPDYGFVQDPGICASGQVKVLGVAHDLASSRQRVQVASDLKSPVARTIEQRSIPV